MGESGDDVSWKSRPRFVVWKVSYPTVSVVWRSKWSGCLWSLCSVWCRWTNIEFYPPTGTPTWFASSKKPLIQSRRKPVWSWVCIKRVRKNATSVFLPSWVCEKGVSEFLHRVLPSKLPEDSWSSDYFSTVTVTNEGPFHYHYQNRCTNWGTSYHTFTLAVEASRSRDHSSVRTKPQNSTP